MAKLTFSQLVQIEKAMASPDKDELETTLRRLKADVLAAQAAAGEAGDRG
jgi:hypothetical protein